MTYIENYICFVSTVVLLQEWLYLSTNLCSSEDVLNAISLKVQARSKHKMTGGAERVAHINSPPFRSLG